MIEAVFKIFAVCNANFFGLPAWYKYVSEQNGNTCTDVNITSIYDVFKILAAILEIALRLGVLVAVGFIIYGGVKFIVSQGDPQGIAEARDTIVNAIIGFIITLLASTIISFIAGRF